MIHPDSPTTDELIQYAKDTEDHIGITDDGFPEMTPNEQAIMAMAARLEDYRDLAEKMKDLTDNLESWYEGETFIFSDKVEKVQKALASIQDFEKKGI